MSTARSASDGFRATCDPIWRALHEHPFITELAAGTLSLERFRFFLEQDNFYLEEYARCLAMGAAKSRTEAELRYFTTDLNQVLDAELPSNRTLLQRVVEMGAADHSGSVAMAPANVAYTSYMHSLALRGGPLEIMASLLPCAWSYVEIAADLRERTDLDHPAYGGWIAYFSLPSNVEMVEALRRDFDALVAEEVTTDARREDIGRIFATSSRLERSFWDMAYTLERWPDLAEPSPPHHLP
jgi:thiaminase (transcriptional activator TenA)